MFLFGVYGRTIINANPPRNLSKMRNRMSKHKKADSYDPALKLLFSHPIMIESLISGFVPQAWTKKLNFSSLQKVNVHHTTDDLRSRDDDIIWKIEFQGQPLYIVCLLEFQSTIDKFMAVRVLTYVGLIYQDLIKQKQVTLLESHKLPPIFSLVFYTGAPAWNAATTLKDCLSAAIPESLRKYQPNIEYMVLDVGQIDLEAYTLDNQNVVSSLIKLEKVGNLANTKVVIDKLITQLKGKQFDSLRRAFVVYINRVWKPRKRFASKEFIDLTEVSIMLSERIDQWEQEKIQQGLQQGLQQGEYKERLSCSIKLLEHKFTAVPASFKAKIEKMPSEALKDFIDRILNATSLEELIES
jgi:hypothetical protein